ncbi:MAG TPA: DUF4304 domain-containing protein [Mucilaginibacter sp.]
MKKESLTKSLDEILTPMAFKKKGNIWIAENPILVKVVQLQKSAFADFYYLNFGVKFKTLETKDINMHIFNRLGSQIKNENEEILSLLTISEDDNKELFKKYVNEKIIAYFEELNTEEDVKNSIGKWTSANTIPLVVKRYLNI